MKRFVFLISLIVVGNLLLSMSFVDSAEAQQSGISNPIPGQTLSEIVIVQGTAVHPNFLRYELAFLRDDDPGTGWIVFADGDQQVVDGQLAIWDTTVGQNVNAPIFPDGTYQLRLRVVRQDFNYDEFFSGNLIIQNNSVADIETATPVPPPPVDTSTPDDNNAQVELSPTPTAEGDNPDAQASLTPEFTPTPEGPTETPTLVPTSTPLATRIAPTAIPTIILDDQIEPPPEVLPTLTAFPTPTPAATAQQTAFTNNFDNNSTVIVDQQAEGVNGVVEGVFGVFNAESISASILRGIRWVLIGFVIVGLYFFLRNSLRWLWRTISNNW